MSETKEKWTDLPLFNHLNPDFRIGTLFFEHDGLIFNHVMKGLNSEPLRFIVNLGFELNVRETPIFAEANEIIRNRLDLMRDGKMKNNPILMNDLLKELLVKYIDAGHFNAFKCSSREFGGLWERDVEELVNDGINGGYHVEWGRDIDNYHYYVKWTKPKEKIPSVEQINRTSEEVE